MVAMIDLDDMDVVKEIIYDKEILDLFKSIKMYHSIDYHSKFLEWLDEKKLSNKLDEKKLSNKLSDLLTSILTISEADLELHNCSNNNPCVDRAVSIKHKILSWKYKLRSRFY